MVNLSFVSFMNSRVNEHPEILLLNPIWSEWILATGCHLVIFW